MAANQDDLPAAIAPSDGPQSVSGIGEKRGSDLRDAGYETVRDLQTASVEQLAEQLPLSVAQEVKEKVGNRVQNVPNIAKAREIAQDRPGAIAKTVRVNGKQRTKVLDKSEEMSLEGGTIEVHKG